jgi:hypothetical protein
MTLKLNSWASVSFFTNFVAGTDAQGLKRELVNYLSLQLCDP